MKNKLQQVSLILKCVLLVATIGVVQGCHWLGGYPGRVQLPKSFLLRMELRKEYINSLPPTIHEVSFTEIGEKNLVIELHQPRVIYKSQTGSIVELVFDPESKIVDRDLDPKKCAPTFDLVELWKQYPESKYAIIYYNCHLLEVPLGDPVHWPDVSTQQTSDEK